MATAKIAGTKSPWSILCFNCALGMIFMLINFPVMLKRVILYFFGSDWFSNFLLSIVEVCQIIFNSLGGENPQIAFQTWMSFSFIGLWVYVLILTLFTIRHTNLCLFIFGTSGLIIGVMIIHLISWISVILVGIMSIALAILSFIALILAAIVNFIASIFEAIFGFIQYNFLTILVLCISLILLFFLSKYIVQIIKYILLAVGGFLLAVGITTIFVPIATFFWKWFVDLIRPINEFLSIVWTDYITPFFSFLLAAILFIWNIIIKVFLFILTRIILPLGVLSTFGHLVVDQFKCAWHAGNGRKGVILGAFAIGSSLALVFLTSIANPELANSIDVAWRLCWEILDKHLNTSLAASGMAQLQVTNVFIWTMPPIFREFVFQNLANNNAPLYDTLIFLLVLLVSYIGIIRRFASRLEDSHERIPLVFFPKEYFDIFGSLLLAVLLIFAQAHSENQG